jgi:hypothetical protein
MKLFIVLIIVSSYSFAKEYVFDSIQKSREIWHPNISRNLKLAIDSYIKKRVLPNGLIYGASVANIKVDNVSLNEIVAKAKKYSCKRIDGFIKSYRTKKPLLYQGKKLPMVFLICPDGGMVRIKTKGNPFDKHNPWPNVIKAVRYPYNATHDDFDFEIFKVDEEGKAIPKSPKDLHPEIDADIWGKDSHYKLGK